MPYNTFELRYVLCMRQVALSTKTTHARYCRTADINSDKRVRGILNQRWLQLGCNYT